MRDRSTGTDNPLLQIYASTRGYCHDCRRKLAFTSYACDVTRGAWDIDARTLRPLCRACLPGHVHKASPWPTAPPAAGAAGAAGAPMIVGSASRGPHILLRGLLAALVLGTWGALIVGLLVRLLGGE